MSSEADEWTSTLWTYHVESRELYVNCLLGPAVGPNPPPLSDTVPPDRQGAKVTSAAETLYAETASLFPPAPTHQIRGKPIRYEQRLHVTHVTEPWGGQQPPTELRLTREIVGKPDAGVGPVDVVVSQLTKTAQAAVGELDRFALASCRRLIDEYASSVIGEPAPDRAPRDPIPAFISYRLARSALADQLHAALLGYGGGAFIAPYLDKHDLRAGELREQFQEAIGARPMFLALATETYAEPDSISADELAFAQKAGVLTVPVLVGSERPTHWPGWKDLASHTFADAADIAADSRSVGRLVELCLRSR